MTEARAIQAFTLIYVAALALSSLTSLIAAPDPHVAVIASAELIALALFALRSTRMIGCAMLIIVFAIAATLDLASGGAPYRFAIYAAAAALITTLTLSPPKQQQ